MTIEISGVLFHGISTASVENKRFLCLYVCHIKFLQCHPTFAAASPYICSISLHMLHLLMSDSLSIRLLHIHTPAAYPYVCCITLRLLHLPTSAASPYVCCVSLRLLHYPIYSVACPWQPNIPACPHLLSVTPCTLSQASIVQPASI